MARRGRARKLGERYPNGSLKRAGKAPAYAPERAQHGPIVREAAERQRRAHGQAVAQLVDARGEIGDPFFVLGLIEQLEADGKIVPEGLVAANEFRRDFLLAFGNRIAASDPGRPVVSGKRPAEISDAAVSARRRVERKLERLGGTGSIKASLAWHVIGLELTIADWLRVRRWNAGKPLSPAEAQAMLIEAVGALAEAEGARAWN